MADEPQQPADNGADNGADAERDRTGEVGGDIGGGISGKHGTGTWEDIVAQLGEDVFKDVPDIIATPARPPQAHSPEDESRTTGSRSDFSAADIDEFVPPNLPRSRMSRRTRLGIGLAIGGPVAAYLIEQTGLVDGVATGYLGLFVSISGLFLIVTSLSNRRRDDGDDTAQL